MKKKLKKEAKRLAASELPLRLPQPPRTVLAHEPPTVDRLARKELLASSLNRAASSTVIVDLDFEALMTDAEKKSIVSQVAHCYGANRSACYPFKLEIRGVKRESFIGQALQKFNVEEWVDNLAQVYFDDDNVLGSHPLDKTIYLSADATEILTQIQADHVYVVGGFVDRNRHKGATAAKAQKLGIRTAKFPLDDFVTSSTFSRVLTTNHVLDVLHEFRATGSWRQAFQRCIPKRKQVDGEKKKKRAVIFGAFQGFGLETTSVLSSHGWSVLAVDIHGKGHDARAFMGPQQTTTTTTATTTATATKEESGVVASCVVGGGNRGDYFRLKNIVDHRFQPDNGLDLLVLTCVPDNVLIASSGLRELQTLVCLKDGQKIGFIPSGPNPPQDEAEWIADVQKHFKNVVRIESPKDVEQLNNIV